MAKPKYTPAQRKEMQRILIRQLDEQVKAAKVAIRESTKATATHRRELAELQRRLKEAKAELKKKSKRAQLQRLPPKWRKIWVGVYDDAISRGVGKGTAAAIAWARVKRYCVKSDDVGEWICMPINRAEEEAIRMATKKAKDLESKTK